MLPGSFQFVPADIGSLIVKILTHSSQAVNIFGKSNAGAQGSDVILSNALNKANSALPSVVNQLKMYCFFIA